MFPKLALGFNTRDLILRRYHESAQWRTEKGTGSQKKKTGAESEAPGKRDEAFTQEEIGKRGNHNGMDGDDVSPRSTDYFHSLGAIQPRSSPTFPD